MFIFLAFETALVLLSIDFLWKDIFITEDLTDFHDCSC